MATVASPGVTIYGLWTPPSTGFFASTELTGTGGSVATAHGMVNQLSPATGVTPIFAIPVPTAGHDGAGAAGVRLPTITVGALGATTAAFTVSDGAKYRIFAFAVTAASTGAGPILGAIAPKATGFFSSTEQTGTGAPQAITHGMTDELGVAVAPNFAIIVPTAGHNGAGAAGVQTAVIAYGAISTTTITCTVSAGAKFRVFAFQAAYALATQGGSKLPIVGLKAGGFFASNEITADGTAQATAHGMVNEAGVAITPSIVIVIPTLGSGGGNIEMPVITYGAVSSTTITVTATTTSKYRIFAF